MRRAMTEGSVAIIVAAGSGQRAGGGVPKQFRPIAGKAVLAHAYDALARHPAIGAILTVVGPDQAASARDALGEDRPTAILTGGASRRESVRAALEYLAANGGAAHVLIHDAARPFLPLAVIDRLLGALEGAAGAIPVLPVADTLARGDASLGAVVDRAGLNRVQTPQAFLFDAVLDAHRRWPAEADATDDAQMVRIAGHAVALVAGDAMLEKLTTAADFDMAGQRLGGTTSARTGFGYDVHRLIDKESLWLCGVQVPHDKGLSGHSDADVALHAIVDAILGALAEGDIGQHFPPSDPQWRGAPSARFLEFACARVAARGGAISHVDVTIVCESPKIGPHRDAMRARLAERMNLPLHRVSVKATTTERLGFAGRGEGIAAQAVATLILPDLD
jgi:2-C-methyl-D-erythritol 4-phosphate cytidylyltransferase/2-C-methyl-D-erythritol 2,4-cyclodiphosphate synthase